MVNTSGTPLEKTVLFNYIYHEIVRLLIIYLTKSKIAKIHQAVACIFKQVATLF